MTKQHVLLENCYLIRCTGCKTLKKLVGSIYKLELNSYTTSSGFTKYMTALINHHQTVT